MNKIVELAVTFCMLAAAVGFLLLGGKNALTIMSGLWRKKPALRRRKGSTLFMMRRIRWRPMRRNSIPEILTGSARWDTFCMTRPGRRFCMW